MNSKYWAYLSLLIVLITSVYFFREARGWVGKPFPGFLLFANGCVGSFNQFDWNGVKAGLRYHDQFVGQTGEASHFSRKGEDLPLTIEPMIFSSKDFWQVFMIPFTAGLLFLILSGLIFWTMRGTAGSFPLLGFNLGIAYYLLGSFDFHTDYAFPWAYTLIFSLIPAFMNHFALVFPERARWCKNNFSLFLPYLFSLLLWIPYIQTFYEKSSSWPFWETSLVGYMVVSYLFWLVRLGQQTSFPTHPFNQVVAKSLLMGQLLAFIIPLIAAVALFLFHFQVPLNWVAPVTLLFPIATLFGLVLGNLRRTQLKLVQSEKMAALGSLLAGVAHEINNPTTFIYSNIPPLKEYLSYLKSVVKNDAPLFKREMKGPEVLNDLEVLAGNVEEGANRIKDIIQSLRNFVKGGAGDLEEVDISAGIESCLKLLDHSIKDRVTIHRHFSSFPKIKANAGELNQVWMNIFANASQAITQQGEIWIETTKEKENIFVRIRDNGAGIPQEYLERIFDPFFTTKGQGEGMGLGLAISREIIERHHGTIEVSSKIGKGTTFTIRLPIR